MSDRARLLRVIPMLFLLHNAEEALASRLMRGEVRAAYARIRITIDPDLMRLDMALVLVTLVAFIIVGWGASKPQNPKRVWAALLVAAVMLLNVGPHLLTAIFVMRGYAPGLVTALAFNLPFSLWLFIRAGKERWITRSSMWMLVPAAIVVHGPLLFLLLKFASVQ